MQKTINRNPVFPAALRMISMTGQNMKQHKAFSYD